jgi:hypothetical protein
VSLRGLAQKALSGGREQGRDADCWLRCGWANITRAGTRGLRAERAPRERKLWQTYNPRSSPLRELPLWIPEATGKCKRGTTIESKDGSLCECGLCLVRDSQGLATASVVKGMGRVAQKLEAELSSRALQSAITTDDGNPLVTCVRVPGILDKVC